MVSFVVRRLFFIFLTAIAIVYFGFLGMHMIDNWEGEDPGYHVGENMRLAAVDSGDFLAGLLSGNLPQVETISGPRPLGELLWFSYKNSMGLLLIAIAAAAAAGMLIGSLAALTRFRGWRYSLLMGTIIGISAPSFLVAVLLQQGGITYSRVFGNRLVSMGGYAWDFKHLAMPLVVLAARPVAYLTRSAYLSLGRVMEEDFIRTAFAKGLSRGRVVIFHAVRNFAVPFLTAVGVSIRFSLSVLPIVEFIFAWPGLGFQILSAINRRVPLLVVSIALVIGLTIQAVSLLLDFTYYAIDPRMRRAK